MTLPIVERLRRPMPLLSDAREGADAIEELVEALAAAEFFIRKRFPDESDEEAHTVAFGLGALIDKIGGDG